MYRHQKHAQYEMTQAGIESKKEQLIDMERVEAEARRLDSALSNGRVKPPVAAGGSRVAPVPADDTLNPPNPPQMRDSSTEDWNDEATSPTSPGASPNEHHDEVTSVQSEEQEDPDLPSYTSPPPPIKRRAPGMGLLNALSYTIHGMMDVDPETARRNSMTKTKESLAQVRNYICAWLQGRF